jgi:hypothetical protein
MHYRVNPLFVVASIALVLLPLQVVAAQTSSTGDVNSEIEVLRADLAANKVEIIKEAMQFKPQESSVFWPIYKEYQAEVSKLNDERVQLIKSYAEKFSTITDADAKAMAEKAFDLESRRTELKKKYFKKFNEQLPATTVAKFFQLEHRLDLLVNLKLASELPSLLVKPAAKSAQAPPSQ